MGYATRKQVCEALAEHGGNAPATYVVRNILAAPYYRWNLLNLKTETVRRQLERLERDGLVERVPSSYARMICWRLTEAGKVRQW